MILGVLCSGNLGFQILKKIESEYFVSFVFSDSASNDIISLCKEKQLPLFIGNPRNGRSRTFLEEKFCDIILSVNYLFLIDKDIISLPSKYAINIHGSLLPKYRGRTPHVWAIINSENKIGITAHIIDEGCDTGDILDQIEVEIGYNDTGAIVLKKYNELYWLLIKRVLIKIETGKVERIPQDHSKATFFGKRTPEDGLINWTWQKERIRNWVRAQADPYPGAFTYINGEKLIIDEVSFDDQGFSCDMSDGLVISIDPLKVKTSNGVLRIDSYRGNMPLIKENQTILG